MRIILIDPGNSYLAESFSFENFINRGLLSIATVLKQNKIKPIYFSFDYYYNLNQDPFLMLAETIKKETPTVVGISNLFIPQFYLTLKIAKFIKQNFPSIKIVLGGMKPTFEHEKIMSIYHKYFDFIIRGEGEWTLKNLMESIYKGININQIKGITYFSGDKVIKNEDALLGDLEQLPVLDYSILPKNYITGENPPNINISIERGCYYKCSFCSVSAFWGGSRKHNLNCIIKELQNLANIGYSGIVTIEDSSINLVCRDFKNFLIEISKIERKYSFDYISTHVNLVDKESLYLLKNADIKGIIFGVESFAEPVLEKIGKKISKSKIIETLKLSKEANLFTSIFIILGLPGENQTTIESTYKNVEKLFKEQLLDSAFVSHFVPLPGTKAREDLKKLNGRFLFKDDKHWTWRKNPHVEYPGVLSRDDLIKYMEKFNELNTKYLGDLRFFRKKGFHKRSGIVDLYLGVLDKKTPHFNETIRRLVFHENTDILVCIAIHSLNEIFIYSNTNNTAFKKALNYFRSKNIREPKSLNPRFNGKYLELKVKNTYIQKSIKELRVNL